MSQPTNPEAVLTEFKELATSYLRAFPNVDAQIDLGNRLALMAPKVERLVSEINTQKNVEEATLLAAADTIYDEWPGGTGNDAMIINWVEDWLVDRANKVSEVSS